MAINIKNTNDVLLNGINIMVYSPAGNGKTTLIKTLPDPLILSAESGLLSIRGTGLAYQEITSMDDMNEIYQFLTESEEAKKYKSVAIDSVSEIAEVCLSHEKARVSDPRQAYGEMGDKISIIIRAFRDLPIHTYMTAKVAQEKDQQGRLLYSPTIPGNKACQNLPYFFDFLLPLHVWKDEETGVTSRMLQTQPDGLWQAKQRGNLDEWEPADLGALIEKVGA